MTVEMECMCLGCGISHHVAAERISLEEDDEGDMKAGESTKEQFMVKVRNKPILPVMLLLLICLISACSFTGERSTYEDLVLDRSGMSRAFESYQIIGEGTQFLTIQCDMRDSLPSAYRIYALLLDEAGYPPAKISGYTVDPSLKGKNHIWFTFFLYDPGGPVQLRKESHYVKFVVLKGNNVEMVHVAKLHKRWGSKKGVRIFDLPSPAGEIPGYLTLRDYTFLAKGDFRKPRGYYVEGKVVGSEGQWTHFVPLSTIQGHEENIPENLISVDQGWLELATGRTHSMKEAVAPVEPYVEGWWDAKGYFHPRPVQIRGLKKGLSN